MTNLQVELSLPLLIEPAASDTSPSRSPPERACFIIETERLCKTYGSLRALADVNVQVPPGTIGLLGPERRGPRALSSSAC